jgi:tRNA G18 (ribose-2'-O)-methylase SpoU
MRVPVVDGGDAAELVSALGEDRPVVGTRARDAEPYRSADLGAGAVVVLGSEAHGIPPAVEDLVGTWVCIPMEAGVESLNVGIAGALLAFELAARRTDF